MMALNHYASATYDAHLMGRPVPVWYCWNGLVAPKPPDWGAHVRLLGNFGPQEPIVWTKKCLDDEQADCGWEEYSGGDADRVNGSRDGNGAFSLWSRYPVYASGISLQDLVSGAGSARFSQRAKNVGDVPSLLASVA